MSYNERPFISALILDDQSHCRELLNKCLKEYCPSVRVDFIASTVSDAKKFLSENEPDILFLDVELPTGSGFDLINSIGNKKSSVIFVTAHEEYALRALKASAVDFLLKPVQPEELKIAVEKIVQLKSSAQKGNLANPFLLSSITQLAEKFGSREPLTHLTIPNSTGFSMLMISDIIHLKASGNYTEFHMSDSTEKVASKTMKEYEEILDPNQFVKIHKSSVINLNHVVDYSGTIGLQVKMRGGVCIEVARRRAGYFSEKVKLFIAKNGATPKLKMLDGSRFRQQS